MDIFEMSNNVQNNLSTKLINSNQMTMEDMIDNVSKQTINFNGSYMFNDEESMDNLLNQIGLAVQRKGGK